MYCVNIAVGSSCWRLLFRNEEKAKAALESFTPRVLAPQTLHVEDDFGQICNVVSTSINAVMFEDLEKAKLANVELFLHQQRVQAMATKAAQADPGLKASSIMNGGGPAMFSPMGRN